MVESSEATLITAVHVKVWVQVRQEGNERREIALAHGEVEIGLHGKEKKRTVLDFVCLFCLSLLLLTAFLDLGEGINVDRLDVVFQFHNVPQEYRSQEGREEEKKRVEQKKRKHIQRCHSDIWVTKSVEHNGIKSMKRSSNLE